MKNKQTKKLAYLKRGAIYAAASSLIYSSFAILCLLSCSKYTCDYCLVFMFITFLIFEPLRVSFASLEPSTGFFIIVVSNLVVFVIIGMFIGAMVGRMEQKKNKKTKSHR